MRFITSLAVTLVVIASPALAEIRTVKLSVPGMFCASCPYIVEKAINELDGIEAVKADAKTKTAVVTYDDQVTTLDDILFATLSYGYESTLIKEGS